MTEDYWEEVITTAPLQSLMPPAPRYFAACARIPNTHKVILFGGTNGSQNFGDLWLFDGKPANHQINPVFSSFLDLGTTFPTTTSIMQWGRCISVGSPPSPRYGHQVVVYEGSREIIILGGCTVSPESEIVGQTFSTEESLQLMNLNSHLQEQYALENKLTILSSSNLHIRSNGSLEDSARMQGGDSLKELVAYSSQISGHLAHQERETRIAEQAFMDAYKTAKATSYFNKQRARHSNPIVDVYFLDVSHHATAMFSWKDKRFPKFVGPVPACRSHFNAAIVGQWMFVLGGIVPTALTMKPVEATGKAEVFVLDLQSHQWTTPTPINSVEYIKATMQFTNNDLAKAKSRVDAERSMGYSLGAPNGITREYMLAMAYCNVIQWRKARLQEDLHHSESITTSPAACFGGCFTTIHQRILYFGGWNCQTQKLVPGVMFLNVEQEYEKHRRLQEEYCAKVERDLKIEEEKILLENLLSTYELRAMRESEQRAMERERRQMTFEDVS